MDFEHSNFALAREIIHSREKSKQFIHRSFVTPPPPPPPHTPLRGRAGIFAFQLSVPCYKPNPRGQTGGQSRPMLFTLSFAIENLSEIKKKKSR